MSVSHASTRKRETRVNVTTLVPLKVTVILEVMGPGAGYGGW